MSRPSWLFPIDSIDTSPGCSAAKACEKRRQLGVAVEAIEGDGGHGRDGRATGVDAPEVLTAFGDGRRVDTRLRRPNVTSNTASYTRATSASPAAADGSGPDSALLFHRKDANTVYLYGSCPVCSSACELVRWYLNTLRLWRPSPLMLPAYAELHCLSNFSLPARRLASRRSWSSARRRSATRRSPITDECSLAGVVRAHVAAKDARAARSSSAARSRSRTAPKLVLLATDRAGYGDLCAADHARAAQRAKRAATRSTRDDVATLRRRPASRCWLPPDPLAARERATRHRSAPRAGSRDASPAARGSPSSSARRRRRARLDALRGARARDRPAAGRRGRRPHARARAAARCRTRSPRSGSARRSPNAGYALIPNGERHLRSRARARDDLSARSCSPRRSRSPSAARFSLDELRYEYPEEIVPARRDAGVATCARSPTKARARRYGPRACPPRCAS